MSLPAYSSTLPACFRRAVERTPQADALVFPDVSCTYQQLLQAAEQRARSLVSLGIAKGAHVGILMPNCLEYMELLLGATMIGAVAVPMNARYKAAELAYVVENADLACIITSDLASEFVDFAQLLTQAFPDIPESKTPHALSLRSAPELRFVAMDSDVDRPGFLAWQTFETAAKTTSPALVRQREATIAASDNCIMMYTSGTTANPKGCPLAHGQLVRNGANMNRQRYFLNSSDRFWAPLPMFHMSSILPFLCCIDAGAALLSMNRVDAGAALRMMAEQKATVAFPAFPTVTNELITHADFSTTDLSHLRRINNVAPVEVLRRFQNAFPQAVQTGAYGLTEACGVVAFNHPDEDLETRLHTCGQAFTGIDVLIVDPDTLQELPAGQRGEIWLRGYACFGGYYKSPDKNAESFYDGWFRTGDLCSVDEEGRISFHGRIKDMLKVGGENVAAIEIESFLATHPAVKLAQVIGMADERLLEVAAAFVELESGAQATEDDIINFCRGKIASFKIPRRVVFVTEWPMSSTKVQKFRLKEWL